MRAFVGALFAALLCLLVGNGGAAAFDAAVRYPYTGPIHHIFFHSLVVYPDKAFASGFQAEQFKAFMVTRDQFIKILDSLHERHFVLIDPHALYEVSDGHKVVLKQLLLPAGKIPLIVSLDDLSYYPYMAGKGFASALVLDGDGRVATAVPDENGVTEVTRTGDVVPILDDFVARHPDFSLGGAKGIIALTGYAGILGYRTQSSNKVNRAAEQAAAAKVIDALKKGRWLFASHSYSHQMPFKYNTISVGGVQWDTDLWKAEVEPLVGPTDIFVGPFGQMFRNGDPRRGVLVRAGFHLFCGVGVKPLLNVYDTNIEMDRADIDGFRIDRTPQLLAPYFDAAAIALRGSIGNKPIGPIVNTSVIAR